MIPHKISRAEPCVADEAPRRACCVAGNGGSGGAGEQAPGGGRAGQRGRRAEVARGDGGGASERGGAFDQTRDQGEGMRIEKRRLLSNMARLMWQRRSRWRGGGRHPAGGAGAEEEAGEGTVGAAKEGFAEQVEAILLGSKSRAKR